MKTDETRRQTVDAISRLTWRAPTVGVRVNAVGTRWFEDDVTAIVEGAGRRRGHHRAAKDRIGRDGVGGRRRDRSRGGPPERSGRTGQRSRSRHSSRARSAWSVSRDRRGHAAARDAHLRSQVTTQLRSASDGGDRRHRPVYAATNGRIRGRGSPSPPARSGFDSIDGPYAAFQEPRARRIGSTSTCARFPGQVGDPSRPDRDVPRGVRPNSGRVPLRPTNDRRPRCRHRRPGEGATVSDGSMVDEASQAPGRAHGRTRSSPGTLDHAPTRGRPGPRVEQFGAGPWGTLQLADLGAEVIKIEDPSVGGDVARAMPPYIAWFRLGLLRVVQSRQEEHHPRHQAAGRPCRVRRPRGPVGCGLLEPAWRPAGTASAALADLANVNPRVVCVSLSGYGMTGPRASEGAYDATIQALTGWMSLTGGPDEPPTKSGLSLADFIGGYVAALALVAGVWRARRDGVGGDADLSLFETALAQLNYMGAWSATGGWQPSRVPGVRASDAHPVPDLRGRGRVHHRRVRQGILVEAVLRRDRATRSSARSPVCGLRFARPSSRCAFGDPPRCHGKPHRRRLVRRLPRRAASRSRR